MTPSQSLFTLTLVLANAAQMTGLQLSVDQERSSFLSPTVGDNITLPCLYEEQMVLGAQLYWYKQSLGVKPTLVSSLFKYDQTRRLYGEFHSNLRFTLDYQNHKNNLNIKNVQMSDSAVYLCVSCVLHQLKILESVTVFVKSLNTGVEVRQSPHEDTEPGRSVTLNCSVHTGTCDGPHRVYWFKQSEESAAGVLYSHGGSSDQCGRNMDSQTNSCVYNLPIHNVSSEQTGTYYCAVASCGQVLFGNGTRINKKPGVDPTDPTIYVLTGALVFTSVLVVLLTLSLCFIIKKYSSLSTELKSRTSSEDQDPEVDHLHYAAVSINPSYRKQRITAETDCVYSGVNHDN